MKDKCKECKSTNTIRKWGKAGMFVSYYTLICNDCGHEEECREQD
jgi:hypothetical protein